MSLALVLFASILAQAFAAGIALHQMTQVIGRYRFAWGCVSLALTLMVQRRISPLWRLFEQGDGGHMDDALIGLAISLLMAAGLVGVRRLFGEIKLLSQTDELTSLFNRRQTLESAANELDRATRSHRPLAFLMFDIDHFKRVNDTYGHPAGDEVLRSVAAIAKKQFRRIDIVGRIGGEEFLVILPESDREKASGAAERLRTAIAAEPFNFAGAEINTTISIGVKIHSPGPIETTMTQLLAETDTALYQAKESGRNRVVIAPD